MFGGVKIVSRTFPLNLKAPANGFWGGVKSPWRTWRTWRGNLNKYRILSVEWRILGPKVLAG
jgi:hypothetical protein